MQAGRWCCVLALLVVAVLSCGGAASSVERRQGCQANGTAQVLEAGARRAVGATTLTVGTLNVDLINGAFTSVEFDPPFDPAPRIISGQCTCGSIINGVLCDATYFFPATPLAESLVGRNITMRVKERDAYVTNWTRVAVVMPAPLLLASNATWSQYGENLTVHGQHLGLPVGEAVSRVRGGGAAAAEDDGQDDDLHLYFTDSNGTAIAACVTQVSDDATSAQVQFDAVRPALGPLWARAELWDSGLTEDVQVATVVSIPPDATSTLNCSSGASRTANAAISIDEGALMHCIVYIQGEHQPAVVDNLQDFSFYLGVGSHGLLGKASLRADNKSIEFNYTAPDSEGMEVLHVTFRLATEIVGSPLSVTIAQHKPDSGGSNVPWHIIIPVSAAGGGLILVAFVIAWVVWVRRRRRCHYEVINAHH